MNNRLLLVIDTTICGVLVGLARWDLQNQVSKCLGFRYSSSTGSSSSKLPETVEELLESFGHSVQDLDSVLVSEGPGSFTGIKVGIAFAQGLRAGGLKSLEGFSTFRMLAEKSLMTGMPLVLPMTKTSGFVGCAVDGEMKIYLLVIEKGGATSRCEDEVREGLPEPLNRKGSVVRCIAPWSQLEEFASGKFQITYDWVFDKMSEWIIETAVEKVSHGNRLGDREVKPQYLRKSAPEEKLDESKS